jgi:hypothetical protein
MFQNVAVLRNKPFSVKKFLPVFHQNSIWEIVWKMLQQTVDLESKGGSFSKKRKEINYRKLRNYFLLQFLIESMFIIIIAILKNVCILLAYYMWYFSIKQNILDSGLFLSC